MPVTKFQQASTNQPAGTRISVEAAAAYIGLSESTLNKLRMTGSGPEFLKLGRRILYDTGDLDAWMATRRRKSTSDNGSAEAA